MYRVLLLLVAITGALALPGRIVGGQDASPGQFYYQVSLRQNGNHFCGGTIINDQWIVTAAHCVYSLQAPVVVVTGSIWLSQSGQAYPAKQVLYHADYDPNRMQNDIALIQVQGRIAFDQNVQPINLGKNFVQAGTPCVLSGWGLTSTGGSLSNILQYLIMTAIDTDVCRDRWSDVNTSHICTTTPVNQGACQGDSGGPLVCEGKLSGIVSYGEPCAHGQPDVFTRVSAFTNWVVEVIEQAS